MKAEAEGGSPTAIGEPRQKPWYSSLIDIRSLHSEPEGALRQLVMTDHNLAMTNHNLMIKTRRAGIKRFDWWRAIGYDFVPVI
jgi:hypothetical protein